MIWAINDHMDSMEALGLDYVSYIFAGRQYCKEIMRDCGYSWPMIMSKDERPSCPICKIIPMSDEPALWLWECGMCGHTIRRDKVCIAYAGHAPLYYVKAFEPEKIVIITFPFGPESNKGAVS